MEQAQAKQSIEALLFVMGGPVALKRITDALPALESAQIRSLIQSLNTEYGATGRAFHIQEVAGGYQLVTNQDLAPGLKKALQQPKPDAVSQTALETLAIIAYRQPITKAEVESIRGVDISAPLETLVERNFVRAAGRKDSPGRPFLYATTPEFLRHFGLKSVDALPSLGLPTVTEPTSAEPATVGEHAA